MGKKKKRLISLKTNQIQRCSDDVYGYVAVTLSPAKKDLIGPAEFRIINSKQSNSRPRFTQQKFVGGKSIQTGFRSVQNYQINNVL